MRSLRGWMAQQLRIPSYILVAIMLILTQPLMGFAATAIEKPRVTEISCGNTTVKIASYCHEGREGFPECSKQVLSFLNLKTREKRNIVFKDKVDGGLVPISRWACLKNKKVAYVELWFCFSGSCVGGPHVHDIQTWAVSGKRIRDDDPVMMEIIEAPIHPLPLSNVILN